MNKAILLDALRKEIKACHVCKARSSGEMVFGEGSSDAKVMFIGEAPGHKEAQSGRPFIGRSGKLLRALIEEIGLREDDVYITSPVKYLPDSGTPTISQIEHAKTHFEKQLEIINPKIYILLGATAVFAVL